jgi:excisionase family DNA binding protein
MGIVTQRYATTGEAAREVGVSATSLLKWLREGTIKAVMVTPGGHARWDIADLRRQLKIKEPK